MSLLVWLYNTMAHKRDPETQRLSEQVANVREQHEVAKRRLDRLVIIEEQARIESLRLQAEVVGRSSRRG